MNVALELENASHPITEYLDDEQDIELGQEHELKAFQRTVDDLRLRCSNLDGQFSSWLGSPSSVKPRIVVKDEGRVLFRGEIEQPISFDVQEEWTSFDCFSMTKAFWDLCRQLKVTKATPVGKENDLWTTVEEVITREITMDRFGHLIAGYQIASIYSARPIRFWGYTADQTIGNYGRYKDLDPRTTLDELLKAMMLYYNADIFIDPETQLLVMQKRDEVQSDVNHQLDDVLEEDEKPEVEVYDEKVDYISLALNMTKPAAPTLSLRLLRDSSKNKGLAKGRYRWAVTFVYRLGNETSETPIGDKTESHELSGGDPNPNPGAPSQNISYVYGARLTDINLGPGNCIARKIYRTRNGGDGTLFLVGVLDNNNDVQYDDIIPDNELGVAALEADRTGMIWMSYDEAAGEWQDNIYGEGSGLNTPSGDIFDIAPKLRFNAKPDGYGIEIASIYAYKGHTRVRTKVEHNMQANEIVFFHHINSVGLLENTAYKISEVFPDALTFEIANMSAVTQPGTAGTVIRSQDMDKASPEELVEDLFYTFAFFGHEIKSLDLLRDQWTNLFRNRKRVKCTVKGLAYRLGDSASLNRKYNDLTIGKCVIKKAKNNLTTERTRLELLTL
jgi:hypothetical protein